jgi:cytochrome c-type biogenesis protein CcmH
MTLTFLLLAAVMVGAALFFLLRTVFATHDDATGDAGKRLLATYRAQFEEIRNDVSSGELHIELAETAEQELGRELLHATVAGSEPAKPGAVRPWITAAALAVLLPGLALLLYLHLGDPNAITLSPDGASADAMHPGDVPSVQQMVERLEQRLQREPDDQRGWMMLGRSYMALHRYDDAVIAMKRLYSLAGDNADVLVRYADALAMAGGGSMRGEPAILIQKALAVDPDNRNGLWLAGTAAAEQGDPAAAVRYWEKLLPQLAQNDQDRMEVKSLIEQAQSQMAAGTETAIAGSESGPAPASRPSIRVHVDVAPELRDKVDADATVFVLAKAINGPPMPLAVVRRGAGEIPFDVTLDDSGAMAPIAKLSNFKTVNVSARISRSGRAERESGDLIGEASGVNVGDSVDVNLTINVTVP